MVDPLSTTADTKVHIDNGLPRTHHGLTVVQGKAGAPVRRQKVAPAAAAQEAAHGVHALLVAPAAGLLTLVDVCRVRGEVERLHHMDFNTTSTSALTQAVGGGTTAEPCSVQAVATETRAHKSSQVIRALLLAGRGCTNISSWRRKQRNVLLSGEGQQDQASSSAHNPPTLAPRPVFYR